jgi:tetratricopeptide (TPR) repeat protein
MKNMLRLVCLAGLILATVISIPLLFVSLIHAKENALSKENNLNQANSFVEYLNEFDQVFAQNRLSPPINRLDALLNTAEQDAVSAEYHLSVLKRRRILAKEIPEYRVQYRNAAVRSLEKFPYSENMSIIAGDALLLNNDELDDNERAELSQYINNISVRQNARNTVILLGFYLFEGSARNLLTAKQIPQAAEMFIAAIDHVENTDKAYLILSGAILQILAGNHNEAVNLIHKYRTVLLAQPESAWFMVETLYDFDDPLTAVSILGIENYPNVNSQSIIRLADALYRTDNTNDARFFWNLLTFPDEEQAPVPEAILEKALYNLAYTAQTDDENKRYLEELLVISPDHIPGILLYSRLLNHEDAISMLHQTLAGNKNPLLELELIRQNRMYSEPGKTAADTWLLLGRYPTNTELYQWASYYFEEMRMFDEADQLKKNAGYNNIDASWLTLQKALDAMRNNSLEEAEQLLTSIPSENAHESGWEIPANLGLIKEKQLSFSEAMRYYETASSLCENNKDNVLIQLNLARCLRATGNPEEAMKVLRYAQDLDPENLRIRLELRKL